MPQNGKGHTAKAYDEQLNALWEIMETMGDCVREQLKRSVLAVVERDGIKAEQVIQGDDEVDRLALEVHELTFSMLALRQPAAIDLRAILAARKISTVLERIGDYSTNIAKRSKLLISYSTLAPVNSILRMGVLAGRLLETVLMAYKTRDAALADTVWHGDEELDLLYTALLRESLTYMMEDQKLITPCTHVLFIVRNLERIGDHAVNIAEAVHFHVTGEMPPGGRPKINKWVTLNGG